METSCSSQKKIRKMLRSRKVSIPLETKVAKPKNCSQKPTIAKGRSDGALNNFSPKEVCSSIGFDTVQENDAKKTKTVNLKTKMNVRTKLADIEEVIVHRTNSIENNDLGVMQNSLVSNGNDMDDDLQDFPALCRQAESENQNDNQREKEDEEQNHQFDVVMEEDDREVQNKIENKEDGAEFSGENCFEDILKGFHKDIVLLYKKTNRLESDVKQINRQLNARPSHQCNFRTLSAQFKGKSAFSLIPKLPLSKRSHVRKMQSNIGENEEYEEQFVNKLASFGGNSVQEVVINIFKRLFTPKFKTKYCWRGSSKGKGKTAFKQLTNVVDVIWSAAKVHFEDCTETMIVKEIKLRLNQAQKDFDREMEKENLN